MNKEMNETLNMIINRPRFKLFTHLTLEESLVCFKDYLRSNSETYSGRINKFSTIIYVKTESNDYWKPYLDLKIEKEKNRTSIRGIYGPSPAVWTFFLFLYFTLSVFLIAFVILFFVESQKNISIYPWALESSLVFVALLALTYLASKIGQFKARKETNLLKHFVEESTKKLRLES